MPENEAGRGSAGRARRLREAALPEGQSLGADQARQPGPGRPSQHQDEKRQRRAEEGGAHQDHEQPRDHHEYVHAAHQNRVPDPTGEPGGRPGPDPDHQRQRNAQRGEANGVAGAV